MVCGELGERGDVGEQGGRGEAGEHGGMSVREEGEGVRDMDVIGDPLALSSSIACCSFAATAACRCWSLSPSICM